MEELNGTMIRYSGIYRILTLTGQRICIQDVSTVAVVTLRCTVGIAADAVGTAF